MLRYRQYFGIYIAFTNSNSGLTLLLFLGPVCFPNGTMTATVLSLDTKPNLDPQKTHLRDKNCGPVSADDSKALFSFPVTACGTTRRVCGTSDGAVDSWSGRERRVPRRAKVNQGWKATGEAFLAGGHPTRALKNPQHRKMVEGPVTCMGGCSQW